MVGLEEKVDFVALSFIRGLEDLRNVRDIISGADHHPMLIAKIEKPQAVENFEQILAAVDAVMVARGDLGVEMPLEEVPMIQKRIIRITRQAGKPVITATQMLGSMVENRRPTRAEATDVANAILDGTDALMLSDETAMGSLSGGSRFDPGPDSQDHRALHEREGLPGRGKFGDAAHDSGRDQPRRMPAGA